jgi:flagellin
LCELRRRSIVGPLAATWRETPQGLDTCRAAISLRKIMALYVNTNVASLFAQRNLNRSKMGAEKALQRLSTGMRINSAADDAAGLAVSTRFRSQIRGLEQAQRNANDGISVIQVAEGAMEQMTEILIRMRELSVQAANGSLTDEDRGFLNVEFNSLTEELDRIANVTSFNGTQLLDGSASAGIAFQVGANNTVNDRITISIASLNSGTIASQPLSNQTISTIAGARSSLDVIDGAINSIASQRADLGAAQNRLSVTIENLGTAVENLSASKARIADADIAKETAELTKYQILIQAGLSVVAQANQNTQYALSLLQ